MRNVSGSPHRVLLSLAAAAVIACTGHGGIRRQRGRERS